MGKLFGDLEYATPAHLYAGVPVEEIKALNAQKSKDYTEARGTKDALDVAIGNLDLRDVDYEHKKKYLDDLKGRIKDTVDKGDWENAKYQVADEVKKFTTDSLLRGAQQERQKQLGYNKDINDRIAKGDLSEEHSNWARANSKDEKVSLNPDGTIAGGFNGHKVLDDKKITKEIYDQVDTRIKDWKPDSYQTINGVEYGKTAGGQYFVKGHTEIVKPGEVYNNLKNEISNSYGDFFQQEKSVDIFNLKKGENRPINSEDFKNQFRLEGTEDIINKLTGLTPDKIQELSKSTNQEERQLAEKATSERAKLTKKLDTDNGKEEIFNSIYGNNQINKYIQGATDKASYVKEDSTWHENHAYTENLKLQNKKKELDYSKKLEAEDIRPAAKTTSEILRTPTTTMEQHQLDFNNNENKIKQLNEALKSTNPESDLYLNLKKELSDTEDNQRVIKNNIVNTLELASTVNPKVNESVIKYLGDDMLKDVIDNPTKYSKSIQAFIKLRMPKGRNQLSELGALVGSLNTTYKDATNKQLLDMIKKEPDYKDKLGKLLLDPSNDYKKIEIMSNITKGLIEAKEKTKQVNVYGYDENTDKDFYRSYIDPAATLIKNNTTVFKIAGTDATLAQYLEETNKKSGFLKSSKGLKADLQKSKFSLVSDPETGDKMMKVTLYDTEGNPIIDEAGEKDSIKEIFVTPTSGEADFAFGDSFRKMISSSNKETVKQGLELEGVDKFAKSGSNIDLHSPDFKEDKVRFSINGQDKTIIIKKKTDNKFELFNENGTPFEIPTEDFSNRNTNFIGGKSELYTRLNILDHAR